MPEDPDELLADRIVADLFMNKVGSGGVALWLTDRKGGLLGRLSQHAARRILMKHLRENHPSNSDQAGNETNP